jgi:hypothetical protein
MNIPTDLTPFILRQKLIIVAKKETNNLDELVSFFNRYPNLIEKGTLIIDDEADIASIGFKRDKTQQDGVVMNVLPTKINNIREGFSDKYSFLQVTATPNSLYLQPSGETRINNFVIQPIRPVFTVLVPVHSNYVGGEEYFEESVDPDSVFSHIHVQVPDKEMAILGKPDRRYISNILSTPFLQVFRQSIINYLVAGSIRIIQCYQEGKNYKSSFIIHTDTRDEKHQWQVDLTTALINGLRNLALSNNSMIDDFIQTGYENLVPSIRKNGDKPPDILDINVKVKETLIDGNIRIAKINCKNEILNLLDRKGQLRLDNPFNIFIGGQILDRGLTIENLIGFFYGRNPIRFQQDTVLQHSRMYGSRSPRDMAVTRHYTSNRIYRTLKTINAFDTALRKAFEKGIHNEDAGVIFIESDNTGTIRPCAPNKILIAKTETIRPHYRYLPIGFQTKSNTSIRKIVAKIDQIINEESNNDLSEPFQISVDKAIEIINLIATTFKYSKQLGNIAYEWDKDLFIAMIKRLVENIITAELKGEIYCYAQIGRNISRLKNNNTVFTDAPDDGKTDIPKARSVATETPCLILLKQNGSAELGWKDAEFWWPILFTPENTKTAIFATETIN